MNEKSGSPRGLDQRTVRHRLARTQQNTSPAREPSPEERREVLESRARALAREASSAPDRRQALEIIQFRLADETYGVESVFVREACQLKRFTPLPGAPPFVLGIINLRGEIISVVDLKKFFSLSEKGLGELNKVIIIGDQQMEFGILADAILGESSVPLDAIKPAPPTVTGIGAEYLKGVTSDLAIILDAQRILGDEKIVVHQEAE